MQGSLASGQFERSILSTRSLGQHRSRDYKRFHRFNARPAQGSSGIRRADDRGLDRKDALILPLYAFIHFAVPVSVLFALLARFGRQGLSRVKFDGLYLASIYAAGPYFNRGWAPVRCLVATHCISIVAPAEENISHSQ